MMELANWSEKGFADSPRRVTAIGNEIVYRVGGGFSSLPLGSFFSPLKAGGVLDAELRNNIVLWNNQCQYVATFRVRPGTEMWIGRVAHGHRDVADRAALQIYIEQPFGRVTLVSDIEALRQEYFVSPRAARA